MLRQPAEGRRERFLEVTVWVSHVCHASANNLSKSRGPADESMPGKRLSSMRAFRPIVPVSFAPPLTGTCRPVTGSMPMLRLKNS